MNALLLSGTLLIASILSMPTARAVDRQMEDEARAAVELMQARQQIEAEEFLAAEQLLEAARTRAPDDPDIHSLLGYCARRLGRLDESYAHYQRALRLDPRTSARTSIWGSSICSAASPSRPQRSSRSWSACAPRAARSAASWPKPSWHTVPHRHLSPTSLPPSRR